MISADVSFQRDGSKGRLDGSKPSESAGVRQTKRHLRLKGKAQGVVVTGVEPESSAEKAGVMRGDVIREINRQPVKSVKEFEKVSLGLKKGENVLILIDRRGNALFLSAKI